MKKSSSRLMELLQQIQLHDVRACLKDIEEAKVEHLKIRARDRYIDYVSYVHKGLWKRARHLELLCSKLEEIERGTLSRLIITMPPRHGKSMTVTETFPSWFIGRSPERRVIELSYGNRFAKKFGRENRRKIEDFGENLFGIKVARGNRSVTDWGLEKERGGMISVSINGQVTGEGADLLIVDDPIRNHKDAESATYRESLWAEWQSTVLTRLHPNARMIIIMTRWHEDDLVGRLLKDDEDKEWTIVNLPAIAEEDGDILGRKPEESLWPEHGFDEKWAQKKKRAVGSRVWDALYQGHPSAAEGNLFKRQHFRKFRQKGTEVFELLTESGPRYVERSACRIFQTCDVAGSTKSSADYFVVGTFALTPLNEILVLDIFRTRIEGPDQPGHMRRLFQEWKPLIQAVESKNMGLTLFQQLVRDGLPIIELKAESDKYTRAIPAAARYEAGSIYHLDSAHWIDEFEKELASFPNGSHDDQADVIAYAALVPMWGYLDSFTKPKDRAFVFG